MIRFVLLAALVLSPAALEAQAGRAAFDEGMRLMRESQHAKAESQFARAVKREPNVAEYQLWLGRAVGLQAARASVLKQPFMARRIKSAFERAVQLDPTLIDARDGLIQFYLAAPGVMGGSKEKARAQQVAIAKLDRMRGHQAEAVIAWHGRDTVATERALRSAVASAPDSTSPVILLAQRLDAWGRTDEAFATLDTLLVKHPRDVAARFHVGRLAALRGVQLARGEQLLRQLLTEQWEAAPPRPTKAAVQSRLDDILKRAAEGTDAALRD